MLAVRDGGPLARSVEGVHYQSFKDGQHMANRYYRKSAVLHESLLTDPSLAESETEGHWPGRSNLGQRRSHLYFYRC
jgi:hypothetical protein